jgi:ATP-dependent Zn protease
MGRTATDLRRTAYHEAGHAVIHRVMGMVCGEASIVPDYDTMCGGYAIAADHYVTDREWERRGKLRDCRSILRGRIIGYMAGREAEIVAFGRKRKKYGDDDDLLQIALMAEEADVSEAYLERLRPKVGPLLRRHWRKVEAVAETLLVHKTLSGAEINAIIGKQTTSRERAITKRIEAARKPIRDQVAWKFRQASGR